ncbi:type II toxin-antitoxin system HipA family toxin [Ramlibacter tataouinensis]|uniref:Phosphatidylinositol kinase n=1 Tax=Ramlibacter tataouinensis (strain ATCC BAA-407 / DSM 14655 / LMG 21543 / TTB310) TaxID=365046 RepID=F5Y3Q7_RAMTT|nr:type II toxin-antitoxin system HipA family toxin [Ramlibacter tataouinensis]AEG93714.1 Conserved hypothetical protein [Ramlibacter tataouinensis TTB310]
MRLRALDIFLRDEPVGLLFQYGEGPGAIARLRPLESFWRRSAPPVLSWATLTAGEAERDAFWAGHATQRFFNGQDGRLPAFFQNMLPEGLLRRHLAQLRGCREDDHFEILATCGADLPGAVYARPAQLVRDEVERIVTQGHDALEVAVTAEPVAEATSLSGIQPKLSLVLQGGRYVQRTRDAQGLHTIAKLPTVEFPLLPEVEALSLQLAAAAGVEVCQARLEPLAAIAGEVPFELGGARQFLAVTRFDRRGGRDHVHCEDFAQVLGIQPERKYGDDSACYAIMAQLMLQTPALGEAAAVELLRRIAVNELLGNYDAHVKNFGLVYQDGRTPRLAPAYDVVAYAAYLGGRGHALRFTPGGQTQARLSPRILREFCSFCGLAEPIAHSTVRQVVKRAAAAWPDLINASGLLDGQKQRLLAHLASMPMVQSLRRRAG